MHFSVVLLLTIIRGRMAALPEAVEGDYSNQVGRWQPGTKKGLDWAPQEPAEVTVLRVPRLRWCPLGHGAALRARTACAKPTGLTVSRGQGGSIPGRCFGYWSFHAYWWEGGRVGLSPAPLGRSFSISRLKQVRVYSSDVSYLLCCVAVFDG